MKRLCLRLTFTRNKLSLLLCLLELLVRFAFEAIFENSHFAKSVDKDQQHLAHDLCISEAVVCVELQNTYSRLTLQRNHSVFCFFNKTITINSEKKEK